MIRAVLVSIACAVSVVPAARADEPPTPVPDDPRARERELYDEGKAHFDIAEYGLAIEKWKQAYLLGNEPLLLFNIAQAYRLGGDCAQANRFYDNYQRLVPEPPNRAELEVATAKCFGVEPATVDTSSAPPEPPAPSPEPPAPSPEPPAPVTVVHSDPGSRPLRISGYVLAGAGVAAGVTAGVFAMSARRDARAVRSQPAGSPWTQALIDQERHGQQAQTRARIFGVVAAAAVVGGGVLWWLGRDGEPHVEIAVGERHAEVALSCVF